MKIWSSLVGGCVGAIVAVLFLVPGIMAALDRLFPVYSPIHQAEIERRGDLVVFSGRLRKNASCIVPHGAVGRVALRWNEGSALGGRLVPLLNPDGSIRVSSALYESGDEITIEMAWDQSRVAEAAVVRSWDVRLPCRRYAGLHDTVAVIGPWTIEQPGMLQ